MKGERQMELQDVRKKLLSILREYHPDIDFEKEESLITGRVLDSFDMVHLVTEFTEEFDVDILASDVIPDNFNTVDAMAELVFQRMSGTKR